LRIDQFPIGVSFGRPINPVTKRDWEEKGVQPNVKVSAADSSTTAEKLAAEIGLQGQPALKATQRIEGSDSFVTSAAASTVTGWNEPVPERELHR
jgi:hypothetical protein